MPRHLISGAHEWINEIPTMKRFVQARVNGGNFGITIGSEGQGVGFELEAGRPAVDSDCFAQTDNRLNWR